jgi:hypothetical protein
MNRAVVCRAIVLLAAWALLATSAVADSAAKPSDARDKGDKVLSGMSIVGNDEAPKSLVIVPWKSSELAGSLDVSRGLDDGMEPVDPEVFARELTYYEIRVGP